MRHGALNKTYSLIWNHARQCWQAVSETARGKSKGASVVILSTLLLASHAFAGPADGTVTAGHATIEQAGSNTTINQQTPKLAIDWQSFSIGQQETVNFIQPSASSIALNRVTGAESSNILGSLTANGQVWILNPNGVLFGSGAQVNVGGLVASTLSLSNDKFMAGNYNFSGSGGAVENRGSIIVPDGGTVALMAPVVRNNGSIIATRGNVLLAAAEAVTLTPVGSSLSYTIDRGAVNALVANGGLIKADGGKVVLTAQARDSLAKSVTNNIGIIEANTIANHNGTILLLGDMKTGEVNIDGTLHATAPYGGDGGFIETSAAKVNVAASADISTIAPQGKTGQWLIDPTDFTIAATGGDITGAQLGSNLASNNITIMSTSGAAGTAGNVDVNDTVSWSANKLTLNAQRDININSPLNGSGTAQLALEYGQGAVAAGNTADYYVKAQVNLAAGNNFSTRLGSDGATNNYTVITSLGDPGSTTGTDLQGMQGNLNGNYALGGNIDASATGSGGAWGSAGFTPIGRPAPNSFSPSFRGILDGLGHSIVNIKIDQPSANFTGLFGVIGAGSEVKNVGISGGSINGADYVGGLVGSNIYGGSITNSYSTADVRGINYVGGLSGYNYNGPIEGSYATGHIVGAGQDTGGLVGLNEGGQGVINNSYSTSVVNGNESVGGLVGHQLGGSITYSYATGSVNGSRNVGGLLGSDDVGVFGLNYHGTISNSYATGAASGYYYTGALVGFNSGTVSNSYATGAASGYYYTGALVGFNSGTVSNSYATGAASGIQVTGGLVGYNVGGTVSNSYASGAISGGYGIGGLVGLNQSGTVSNSYATGVVSGIQSIGGLIGYNNNGGTISNNYAAGTVSGDAYIGGLVGYNDYGSISNSYATGAVSNSYAIGSASNTSSYTGGLVGLNQSGNVSNSYAIGTVSGKDYTGGLVGNNNNGTVSYSYATGTVSGQTNVGGLVGDQTGGTIANSHSTGVVVGNRRTGGLLGSNNSGTVSNSYAITGKVTGQDQIGGLIGYNSQGTVSGAFAEGEISGNDQVGGLIGNNNFGIVSNSYATGKIAGHDQVGGLVGSNNFGINNSYSTGVVSGHLYVGGLLGDSVGAVDNSYSSSEVTSEAGNVGGLIGYNTGLITGSHALGSVSGPSKVGGLVGYNVVGNNGTVGFHNEATISDSYTSTGMVNGTDQIGGLVGYNTGIITNANSTEQVVGAGTNVGGLIGLSSGNISNSNATGLVTGASNTGGLVGNNSGIVSYSSATGAVTGTNNTAGLVGYNLGTVSNSNATGNVSGTQEIGGLVGANFGTVIKSYGTGNVLGPYATGGLVGYNQGTVSKSYATGTVSGSNSLGGLVGYNYIGANIGSSYATGAVSGYGNLGGLVGYNLGASVSNSYATGAVSGIKLTGGLIGQNDSGFVSNSYATSTVSGSSDTGGLVGFNRGSVSNSFWDINISGQSTSDGGTGLTTMQMKTQANFTSATAANGNVNPNWDFTNTWLMYDTNTYPLLRSFMTPLTVTATDITKTYDGATFSGGNGITYSVTPNSNLLGTLSYTGTSQGAKNAGSYAITPSGLYSNQQGYIIINANGILSVTPKELTLASLTAANKIYDGNTNVAIMGSSLTGVITGDTVGTSITSAAFDTKNVGMAKTVTATGIGLTGTDAGNYNLGTTSATTQADITAKVLSIASLTATNKIYDGNTAASITGSSLTGVITGDTVGTTITSAAFDTKNVGTAKTVTATGIGLTGTDSGNYAVDASATTLADITPKTLTVSGETAANKVYDRTTIATLSGGTLAGAIAGETVILSHAGDFSSRNAGTKISVAARDSIGGAAALNYVLTQPTGLTADITPKALTIASLTAANKVYDGNTTASITGASFNGVISGDTIGATTGSANFNNKNVGVSKVVTATGLVLSGADAANYSLSTTSAGTTANITAKPLSISGFASANKVYDRTTAAVITSTGNLAGVVVGDTVGFTSTTATFANRNAGLNKTVTLNGVQLNGIDAGNYSYSSSTTTDLSDITPKFLTINKFTAYDKRYDGNNIARVNYAGNLIGIISGDTIGFYYSNATFVDQFVGKSKTVTLNGVTLNGVDSVNYLYKGPTTTKASITP